eukprot:scaffold2045_cov404-Prasinococcus_capsulatus_cf.AAC.67
MPAPQAAAGAARRARLGVQRTEPRELDRPPLAAAAGWRPAASAGPFGRGELAQRQARRLMLPLGAVAAAAAAAAAAGSPPPGRRGGNCAQTQTQKDPKI